MFDAGGLPVEERQPGGLTVTRTFDQLGRLTGESGTGADADATVAFGWDLDGRRTSISHPDGTIGLAYDDRGLPATVTTPGRPDTTYTHDGAGRIVSRADGAGTTTFGYDARGLLDTIGDPLTGATVDHTHDPTGRLATVTYGTGADELVRTYGYDDAGRVASDTLTDTGGATVHATSYGYLASDHLETQTTTVPGSPVDGTHTYGYEPSGRIASWTPPGGTAVGYGYDPGGNRTDAGDVTYIFDGRNRLTTATSPSGTTGYSWTPAGLLDQIDDGTTIVEVTFDALGRMTGHAGVAYRYDGLGRIVDRTDTAGTTDLGYAGTGIDPVTIGTDTYTRDPSGSPVANSDGTAVGWVGRNRHGDITHTTTATGATLDAATTYSPWGEQAATDGQVGPLGFQGDLTDQVTGLVWQGARWYAPELAIFTARDTVFGQLDTPVTLNRFTYGFADPLRYFDPDGRYGFDGAQTTTNDDDGWQPTKQVLQANNMTATDWTGREVIVTVPHDAPGPVSPDPSRAYANITKSLLESFERGELGAEEANQRLQATQTRLERLRQARAAQVARCDTACLGGQVAGGLWDFGRGFADSSLGLAQTATCTYTPMRGDCRAMFGGMAQLPFNLATDPGATLQGIGAGLVNRDAMDQGTPYWLGTVGPDAALAALGAPALADDLTRTTSVTTATSTHRLGTVQSAQGARSLPVHRRGTLSATQARAFYLEGERGIAALADDLATRGVTARERALELIETRNSLRSHTRDLMANRKAADFLNRFYPNRTLNDLVGRAYHEKGLAGDELWGHLSESASRSNTGVNRMLGLEE